MQAEENSDNEGEEGQAFYAGGSERRYVYLQLYWSNLVSG